ncbi:MAG: sporulation initiation factor Spo0A C-terminal domain-containing protein [Clostridia bacterium]|nr:sporulation initiation factor Spo0A C-terminal domain-containing protein [Clostridia bacterium]
MRCAILALTPAQGERWLTAMENRGEEWQCRVFTEAEAAYRALCQSYHEVCLLCPCPESEALAARLQQRPPLSPPWIIHPGEAIPQGIPPLALQRLEQLTCLSRSLLRALTMQPGLRAWRFLPDMAALTVVHPPLLHDLHHQLYPLIARRHGMTPAAVERSLRTLVESTWSRGSLAALERFFGHSVDPEKGKPTNKEFLCRLQERLTLAGNRLV